MAVTEAKTRRERQEDEVNANYEAFKLLSPELVARYSGKFALIKNGEIVEYFDSSDDAWKTGKLIYKDDVFSVQEVNAKPIRLGWIEHALFQRRS